MKISATVLRNLLGLDFLLNGINFFYHFIPITVPADPTARLLMSGLVQSGIFDVVKVIELATGIALLANRFVPLALVCVTPLAVVIFMVDCLLVRSLEGWAFGGTTAVLVVANLVVYGRHFLTLLQARVQAESYKPDDILAAIKGTLVVALATLLLAGVAVPARAASDSNSCDRACLVAVAASYRSALQSHDPAMLKAGPGVKFTENDVELKLGAGLWKTMSGGERHDIVFADPSTGQVALTAMVREGDRPAILLARLQVRHGAVTALETTVARRETTSFMRPEGWEEGHDVLLEPVEASRRTSHGELVRIAQAYFDRLTDQSLPVPALDERCNRIENGVRTTNNADPFPGMASPPLRAEMTKLSCSQQFALKSLGFVSKIRAPRYDLVDEEGGLVLASVIFDHDGAVATPPAADGVAQPPKLSAALPSPYSYLVQEIFKIEGGKIVHIQAVLVAVPYGMASAW